MSFDVSNLPLSETYQNVLQRTGSDNHLYDLQGRAIGDLKIAGSLFAQQYVVSSSVTVQEFIFNSGSTIFGDTIDDSHRITGSTIITGSLSVTAGTFEMMKNELKIENIKI